MTLNDLEQPMHTNTGNLLQHSAHISSIGLLVLAGNSAVSSITDSAKDGT